MKTYSKPEIETVLFEKTDIICTSTDFGETGARSLKTKVAGNEGTNYGANNVSIFE